MNTTQTVTVTLGGKSYLISTDTDHSAYITQAAALLQHAMTEYEQDEGPVRGDHLALFASLRALALLLESRGKEQAEIEAHAQLLDDMVMKLLNDQE